MDYFPSSIESKFPSIIAKFPLMTEKCHTICYNFFMLMVHFVIQICVAI